MLRRTGVEIFDRAGKRVERPLVKSVASSLLVDKGNHRHFMAKEIHEQPEVISHTLANYIDMADGTRAACPTSASIPPSISARHHVGLRHRLLRRPRRQILDRALRAPAGRDRRRLRVPLPRAAAAARAAWRCSSRSRARPPTRWPRCATARRKGQRIASIVNVRTSTIARESDVVLPTLAGPEIGVASTKAFTCQLSVLACLAIALGRARGVIDAEQERELVHALVEVPRHISTILRNEAAVRGDRAQARPRRRTCSTSAAASAIRIALEGALKLKEISYIHAEGYAAGELKHGPIALIDENVPVIVVAPQDDLFEKTVSNMQEVAARGGQIILISDAAAEQAGCKIAAHIADADGAIRSPIRCSTRCRCSCSPTTRPCFMGTDVDQPRNLAKSVTVE